MRLSRRKRVVTVALLFAVVSVFRSRRQAFLISSFLGPDYKRYKEIKNVPAVNSSAGTSKAGAISRKITVGDAVEMQETLDRHPETNVVNQDNNHEKSDNDNNNNQQQSNEPYVLLHIGPHKTGTTTLQNFLVSAHSKDLPFLKADNLVIPSEEDLPGTFHKMPMLNFAHCMLKNYKKDGGQLNVGMCNRIRKTFPPFLEKSYNASKNVIIVAEDLDRPTVDFDRIRYYLKPYTRIKIVATYRRLHDWLLSFYNQIIDLYMGKYASGEEEYPSFVEWVQQQYEDFHSRHTVELIKRYKQNGFLEVGVVNIHDETTTLMQNFFCNHVPNAKETCLVIRNGMWNTTKSNVGGSHEYERLIIKARYQGKFKYPMDKKGAEKLSRKLVKIMNKAQRGLVDHLGLQCLPDDLALELMKTEMKHEREFFPEWYEMRGGDIGLKIDFEKVSRTKLCSLNVDKILDIGILDDLFTQIK
mmetsp:Transcript_7788/g.16786  ORF Transcript_7788/g.16786 Transcript_7788/m.16786 type:complete len:470 (-) Transcript_7788:27-1436(-)